MSIHKRDSGAYQVKWREGGQQKSRTFNFRKDAERFEIEVKRRLQMTGVTHLTQNGTTLAEFTEIYWENRAERRLGEDTRRQYRSLYQRHVYNQIGGCDLRTLTTKRLLDWQAEVEKELPGPSVIKLMTFLQGVLSYAVQRDEIQANPVRELDKPKQIQKIAVDPLLPREIEAVRKLASPKDQAIISILAYSGLRPGELTRLEWKHVKPKSLLVAAGKTGRERSTILFSPTVADLSAWRELQEEDTEYVFPRFDLKNWRRRTWKPKFAEAGLEGSDRPYRLRSSFVSLLIAAGYPLGEIALSAGHGLDVMGRHYASLLHELSGQNIDPEAEILKAREEA